MIDTVFYTYLLDNVTEFTAGNFHYGSAEGVNPPYYVFLKITDLERPETLCDDQGESGRALFQVSYYEGDNAGSTITSLETVKDQVSTFRGLIGSAIQYRIWNNMTSGVTLLGAGQSSLSIWGAIFEIDLWWSEV